jgi:predicted anti-sigma-YlaC factor YlaD
LATSDDKPVMRCELARELVSADLDGQLAESEAADLAYHLQGCRECQAWQTRLLDATRRSTIRPAAGQTMVRPTPLPDPKLARRNRVLRIMLGWSGILLVTWHVPDMLSPGSEVAVHLARHQAAFAVALGLAFVFVAVRPERAFGMIPFVATFVAALAVTAVVDLVNGSSSLLTESRHLLEIGGLVLVWVLGTGTGPRRRRAVRALARAER